MADLTQKKFEFVSSAFAGKKNPFAVIRFQGVEGLNECYRFEIDLMSKRDDIDLAEVIQNDATFTILRPGAEIPFHGVLAEFEQRQKVEPFTFYRAVLVPRLWWLSNTYYNQVFLDKDFKEMIALCLQSAELREGLDFRFGLKESYPRQEYVCQYRTPHLDFVTSLLEIVGIYYFFEQGETREQVVFTDTAISHKAMAQGEKLLYAPPSGLARTGREEVCNSFVCRQAMAPKSITLKDYNYRRPDLELTGTASINPQGRGDLFHYGDHFTNKADGEYLAMVRAEMFQCQERMFHGESAAPFLRPGYCFTMEGHYRPDFNARYLTTEIHHQGGQACFLRSGLRAMFGEEANEPYYRNNFTAIPAGKQFRPEFKTEYARFYGTINAVIDAEGSGQYAEMDEWGRYKVKLPFDLADKPGAKASHWIRMAQPYAGENYGAHFPLHKGTEVLLTFIDGDPDRPIIAGAVPNPEKASPVANRNQTQSVLRSAGQNQMVMEDHQGKERLDLFSPAAGTALILGQSPGAHAGFHLKTQGQAVIEIQDDIRITGAANHAQDIAGNSAETVKQDYSKDVSGNSTVTVGGTSTETVTGKVSINHNAAREDFIADGLTMIVGDPPTPDPSAQPSPAKSLDLNVTGSYNIEAGENSFQHYKKNLVQWSDQKDMVNHGTSSSFFGGAVSEVFAGAANKVSVGALNNVTVGAAVDTTLALAAKISVGLFMELGASAALSINPTVALALAGQRIYAGTTRIENVVMNMKTGAVEVGGKGLKVDGGGLKLIT